MLLVYHMLDALSEQFHGPNGISPDFHLLTASRRKVLMVSEFLNEVFGILQAT
jgi:hypothetical protein